MNSPGPLSRLPKPVAFPEGVPYALDNPEFYRLGAHRYDTDGKHAEAKRFWRLVLKYDKGDPEAMQALGKS